VTRTYQAAALVRFRRQSGYLFSTRELVAETTFRLTRVTRIFQKKVFTETTPEARAGCRTGLFAARPRRRPRAASFFSSEQEKSHAVPKGPKRKPGRAPARVAQSDNHPHASFVGGSRGGDRKVIQLAEDGDMAAIRLCMDRLAPAPKDEPVDIELPPLEKPADSVAAAASIVAGVAAGDLTLSQAGQLAKVIDVYVRAIETKAFDERLSTVEQAVKSPPALGSEGAMHDDACF
jgi:hypothetical protein